MVVDYFYDAQIRRYQGQFLRIFLNMQYASGKDKDGNIIMKTIPAKMAMTDRVVAAIMQGNSENTILTFPQISCFMTDIRMNPAFRRSPNHVDIINVVERQFSETEGDYVPDARGHTYSVERFMPVPYLVTMQTDIWTSNELQKHQIMEQILTLFNPTVDIQTGTNAIDWTSLTSVELKDIRWSQRGIPVGNNSVDIASLTFEMPIWISPPAKVKRQNMINQIITNINDYNATMVEKNFDPDTSSLYWSESDVMSRLITTPGNHIIDVSKNGIKLLGNGGATFKDTNQVYDWKSLFEMYGTFREGTTQLRLKTNDNMDDHESDIVGTLRMDPNSPNNVFWDFDLLTLPQNTLPAVNGVINPMKKFPDNGLPPVQIGQRYLIIDNIFPSEAWGDFEARENDIIEYGEEGWFVEFEAAQAEEIEYVDNRFTGDQLMLTNNVWEYSIYRRYRPGQWRLFI